MILQCNLCGDLHDHESICVKCRADLMAALLETWNIAYARIEKEHKNRLIEIHEEHIGPIDEEDVPKTCLNCAHNKESCEQLLDGKLVQETVRCDLNGEIYYPFTRHENIIDCGWKERS